MSNHHLMDALISFSAVECRVAGCCGSIDAIVDITSSSMTTIASYYAASLLKQFLW